MGTRAPTVAHFFAGLGGGALGFRRAGFRGVLSVDNNAAACRDHERIVGEPAICADMAELQPQDVRAMCPESPDVLFTSPPCKAFSGCLPEGRVSEPKYIALNSLAFRGVWLALESWPIPPRLLVLENVPRIQSRGRLWLEKIVALLHSYGYAVDRRTHDCGELGGLAQRRRRYLLVARHMERVGAFLRVPSLQRVRGIGEVLGQLPVPLPDSVAGGPMHRLNQLCALNWVRLALIPAGGDWRSLPHEVRLPDRAARQNGPLGVERWDDASHAVLSSTKARDTWGSVADPRLGCTPAHTGHNGVESWDGPARTIRADHRVTNAPAAVADPRVTADRFPHALGVRSFDAPALTIRGTGRVQTESISVADPRLAQGVDRHAGAMGIGTWEAPSHTVTGQHGRRGWDSVADPRLDHDAYRGCRGVQDWGEPSKTIRAKHHINNSPAAVADPRLGCEPRGGTMGVEDWALPSHTVIGQHVIGKAPAAVADPRVPELVGPALDIADKRSIYLVICAADGTWHRPMTTLELAALQGLPVGQPGTWLELDGRAQSGWRERIGNAVPPPAAEAIAIECAATLAAAESGRWELDGNPIWVRQQALYAEGQP